MLCINPYRKASGEFGCGQCICCRINRKRTWAARIVLENAACKEGSSFVTLTYDDAHLPPNNSLSAVHWRQFTKGIGYRYFGVGEYGDRTGRPHYHLVIFGLPIESAEAFAAGRWGYGFVSARPFCIEHGLYVAAYTTKKMTNKDDSRLQAGQEPEFARMSRRPGIGVPALAPWSSWLTSAAGCEFLYRNQDVPSSLHINGSFYPMARTLRDKLRAQADVPADLPARTHRRELAFRVAMADPVARGLRERKRVMQYERRKALSRRSRGTL